MCWLGDCWVQCKGWDGENIPLLSNSWRKKWKVIKLWPGRRFPTAKPPSSPFSFTLFTNAPKKSFSPHTRCPKNFFSPRNNLFHGIVLVPASISETASHMFAYFNNLSLVDPVGALATIGFYVSKIDLSDVYGRPGCSSCSSAIHKDFWVIKTWPQLLQLVKPHIAVQLIKKILRHDPSNNC